MSDTGILPSPSARSNASSVPPAAHPQQMTAEQLRQTHPLWQRAAGTLPAGGPSGGGRGGPRRTGGSGAPPRGGGDAGDDGSKPRYEPLSALALELTSFRQNADGDSALFSETSSAASLRKAPRARRVRANSANDGSGADDQDDGPEDGGFSALASSDDELSQASEPRKRAKAGAERGKRSRKDTDVADAAMYASAAVGGAYAGGSASDVESTSQVSDTTSVRRKAAH